jgi:A/G-specific adenine glycosylase
VSAPDGGAFAARIIAWQARHGRRDLPWQASRDPYKVWLSEVMLQQTQVAAVIPYFRRFIRRFPDVRALASAPLEDVLALWSGLGYYARARNLHACAKRVVAEHGGRFPIDAPALACLPGIGPSTAAAVAAFCANAREPILDGNVKRVLARYFGIEGYPGAATVERVLWERAKSLLPRERNMPAYTQALMDLGATVCRRRAPMCAECPVARGCRARRSGRTDELPSPRPARSTPERRAFVLLAVHDGRVLLQQRSPSGLWGGLLSLPQFDSLTQLRRAAAEIDAQPSLKTLPPRRHAFTHFALTWFPKRLDVRSLRSRASEPPLRWLPLKDAGTAPLPAPVRTLLRELATESGTTVAPAASRRSSRRGQAASSGPTPRATKKRDTML